MCLLVVVPGSNQGDIIVYIIIVGYIIESRKWKRSRMVLTSSVLNDRAPRTHRISRMKMSAPNLCSRVISSQSLFPRQPSNVLGRYAKIVHYEYLSLLRGEPIDGLFLGKH